MAMSISALLKAAEKKVVTDEDRRKLTIRLAEAKKRFEEKDRLKHTFPPGFMERQYTI